jgi:hypothetical protein
VPTTATVFVAVIESDVAVIVIVLLLLSPAALKVAVAAPLASVVPLVTTSAPELDANATVLSFKATLFDDLTIAVIVTLEDPSEPSCGLLTNRSMLAAAIDGVTGVVEESEGVVGLSILPPHPKNANKLNIINIIKNGVSDLAFVNFTILHSFFNQFLTTQIARIMITFG